MKLKGKIAIVTGAGGYLGRGIAYRLAEDGASIVVNDINLDEATKTADIISNRGGKVMIHEADITNSKKIDDMINKILQKWNQVDILVNNAGDFRDAMLVNMTVEDWDIVVDLNLKGSFLCSKAVAPIMIKQEYGKIVNITSMAYKGNIGQVNYVSAKAGLIGLTQAVGLELARYKINVNCIAPGLIETPRTHTLNKKLRDRLIQTTPFKCMGEIKDIANTVSFLVSDESKYITRQIIHVSGGMEGF